MVDARLLQELVDRQDIVDCIHRYCRGVDRLDRELVLSAYHRDAVDHHGPFVGTPEQFVDWVFENQRTNLVRHQHMVLNHSADLDGDVAHTETYYFVSTTGNDGSLALSGGRYVDQFRRRSGRWAIASRVCVREWKGRVDAIESDPALDEFARGTRDRSDISYRRPLSSVQVVHDYLAALQRKDLPALLSLLDADFVFEVPFTASGDNDPAAADSRTQRGLTDAAANFRRAFGEIETLVFSDIEVIPSSNPEVVFAEAVGDMRMANAQPYRNRYVFRFDLERGKIRRVREYLNPVTSARAFGRPIAHA